MIFADKRIPLRSAVGHLLLAPQLEGKLCTYEQLVAPILAVGGGSLEDGTVVVDRDLFVGAFKCGESEFVASFEQLKVADVEDPGDHFLFVRNAKKQGRQGKFYEIARFSKGGENGDDDITLQSSCIPGNGDHVTEENISSHPLNLPSVKRQFANLVPSRVKETLGEYLVQEGKDRRNRAAAKSAASKSKAEKKELQKQKAEADRARLKAERKRQKPSTPSKITPPRSRSAASKSPNPKKSPAKSSKKRRKGSREVNAEEQALVLRIAATKSELLELKRTLEKKVAARRKREQQQEEASQNSASSDKENAGVNENEAEADVESSTADSREKYRGKTHTIYYTLLGRAGKIEVGSDGIIFLDDLIDGLVELPPKLDNDKSEAVRSKRECVQVQYGQSQGWIIPGTALVGKDYLTKLKKSNVIVKNLRDLFDGEQCGFSRENLERIAAYSMHNLGGSDEGTAFVIMGAYDSLFHEIGFKIHPDQLAHGCPSTTTIARAELNLAVDTLMVKIQEIRDDGTTVVGIITDHGNRAGQDHFVVVVVWAGLDENGNKTIKFFCPSIDSAGHTAKHAAEGVKNVMQR